MQLLKVSGKPVAIVFWPCLIFAGVAKGLIGAGVGIGVLAGAAAASVFFFRKRRAGSQEGLIGHDLARVQNSIIVTKQKKRAKAAVLHAGGTAGEQPVHGKL